MTVVDHMGRVDLCSLERCVNSLFKGELIHNPIVRGHGWQSVRDVCEARTGVANRLSDLEPAHIKAGHSR